MSNAWTSALSQLDEAAEFMALDENLYKVFREPKRILTVSIPVRMDDGKVDVYLGYRVHHSPVRERDPAVHRPRERRAGAGRGHR